MDIPGGIGGAGIFGPASGGGGAARAAGAACAAARRAESVPQHRVEANATAAGVNGWRRLHGAARFTKRRLVGLHGGARRRRLGPVLWLRLPWSLGAEV